MVVSGFFPKVAAQAGTMLTMQTQSFCCISRPETAQFGKELQGLLLVELQVELQGVKV